MRSGFRRSCSSRRRSSPYAATTGRSSPASQPCGRWPKPIPMWCSHSGRGSATTGGRTIFIGRRVSSLSVTAGVCPGGWRTFWRSPASGSRRPGRSSPSPTIVRPSSSTPTCAVFLPGSGPIFIGAAGKTNGGSKKLPAGFFPRTEDGRTRKRSWISVRSSAAPAIPTARPAPFGPLVQVRRVSRIAPRGALLHRVERKFSRSFCAETGGVAFSSCAAPRRGFGRGSGVFRRWTHGSSCVTGRAIVSSRDAFIG